MTTSIDFFIEKQTHYIHTPFSYKQRQKTGEPQYVHVVDWNGPCLCVCLCVDERDGQKDKQRQEAERGVGYESYDDSVMASARGLVGVNNPNHTAAYSRKTIRKQLWDRCSWAKCIVDSEMFSSNICSTFRRLGYF